MKNKHTGLNPTIECTKDRDSIPQFIRKRKKDLSVSQVALLELLHKTIPEAYLHDVITTEASVSKTEIVIEVYAIFKWEGGSINIDFKSKR